MISDWNKRDSELIAELDQLRAQLETARKALEWIAFGLGSDGSVIEAKTALAKIGAGQKGGE